jgi:hypothetical protein
MAILHKISLLTTCYSNCSKENYAKTRHDIHGTLRMQNEGKSVYCSQSHNVRKNTAVNLIFKEYKVLWRAA